MTVAAKTNRPRLPARREGNNTAEAASAGTHCSVSVPAQGGRAGHIYCCNLQLGKRGLNMLLWLLFTIIIIYMCFQFSFGQLSQEANWLNKHSVKGQGNSDWCQCVPVHTTAEKVLEFIRYTFPCSEVYTVCITYSLLVLVCNLYMMLHPQYRTCCNVYITARAAPPQPPHSGPLWPLSTGWYTEKKRQCCHRKV